MECCCHEEKKSRAPWLIISALLLLLVIPIRPLPGTSVIVWLLYASSYLIVGIPVLKSGWDLFVHHRSYFNEFTLMTLASLGAFAIGDPFEATALMLLYNVGESLQERAVSRAQASIRSLIDSRPKVAYREREDGTTEEVCPSMISPGDIIRLLPGERLAVDGLLLDRDAAVDLSVLTGESMPVQIDPGDEVSAGTIATTTPLRVQATKPYSDSTLARMIAMVEQAQERKSESDTFMRRFARVYTPVVVLLSVLIILFPYLWSLLSTSFEYSFPDWFYRGLVFLVASCPCALVISIPLSFFGGLGAASRVGILFKGSFFLDRIRTLSAFVFDKTGTLTEGRFSVVDALDPHVEPHALELLASIVAHSTHPIARAVVDFAKERGGGTVEALEVGEVKGLGMVAKAPDGREVLVGGIAQMRQAGVEVPREVLESPLTVVMLSVGGIFALALFLDDSLRPESAATLERLHKMGIAPLVVLSGDRPETVVRVAEALPVDIAEGGLLPEQKQSYVAALSEKHRVGFVGDGLNDAPVMACSDVGFAMGLAGSDVTVEAADVVLFTEDPYKVVQAVEISRQTHRVVRQNVLFSISFKVFVMVLALFGYAPLLLALVADVGVALLTILNALRVLYFRPGSAPLSRPLS